MSRAASRPPAGGVSSARTATNSSARSSKTAAPMITSSSLSRPRSLSHRSTPCCAGRATSRLMALLLLIPAITGS
jgi:hypothetical protein